MAATDPFVTVHSQATGPIVRRSWRLAVGPDGVMLTGLFGFPWRDRLVQAKCVAIDPAGRADPFGALRLDRRHRFVPSPECSCGLYATNDPRPGWLQRRFLRHQILVSGFVRLSGRVLLQDDEYRAEEATVVGPVVISLPAPGVVRRRATLLGVRQKATRIVVDGHSYAVRYGSRGRGVPLGDWLRDVSSALRRRYDVEVVGLIPQ